MSDPKTLDLNEFDWIKVGLVTHPMFDFASMLNHLSLNRAGLIPFEKCPHTSIPVQCVRLAEASIQLAEEKIVSQRLRLQVEHMAMERLKLLRANNKYRDDELLKASHDDSYRDDEMEPRPTLEERLDHIERRLTDYEEWRRAGMNGYG